MITNVCCTIFKQYFLIDAFRQLSLIMSYVNECPFRVIAKVVYQGYKCGTLLVIESLAGFIKDQ